MKNNKSKITKIAIAVGVIVLLGAWSIHTLLGNSEEVEKKVYVRDFAIKVPVKVAQVSNQNLKESRRYLGSFKANKEITITSQTQGEVIGIYAEEGVKLKKNSLIARVDSEQIDFQLIAANAAYQDAKREFERYEKLTKQNAVADINLEKAALQLATAESQLKILQKQQSHTRIKVPFAGTLVKREFDLGSVLAPGMPLGTLIDISELKLVISIPEEKIRAFKEGDDLTVHSDVYPTQTYAGVVTAVSAKADKAHKFDVQIKIKNSDEYPLKSGMYGWVEHQYGNQSESLSIPVTALMGSSKDASVFKVVDGKAQLQNIQIGIRTEDFIEVKKGLQANETVVTNGQINLSDGIIVTY
ncbi:efflux RND transporter periplasmic adaptor subunit [Reichenbachiella agarivorans]|uniref:Efflux RND transporter periplasmic adaptor subunit n=1 Tax=Reichenbachiella agarivorans TaxID=2979464 RepID=A0ABY6CVM4_9BACT|nr:efflux RND transporter periplasmic adaptor subunit [Reichenbachiella agarivorans]UXP33448.1 efflux RND transporter periplasmic adaptor subunit [Reichenbachiella agarivorans]